ncbi:hypothetical protein [Halomonas cupida]|uniref:hypothetical protein n=1 Tax=Halomonas cupida TaxID=44933 RepID=UPI003A925B3A
MYFNDWLLHRTLTASKQDITGFEADMKAFEKEADKYGEQYRGFQSRSISDQPSDARSIYRMNDTHMDIRTFFDEWRGGVFLGLSSVVFLIPWFVFSILIPMSSMWMSGVYPWGGVKLY